MTRPADPYTLAFGKHVRSLRRARGLTQQTLADLSTLSSDTIRRLEHGEFSASIDTIRKLCEGLSLQVSTLFASFEIGTDNRSELLDLLRTASEAEVEQATRVVRALLPPLPPGRLRTCRAEILPPRRVAHGDR